MFSLFHRSFIRMTGAGLACATLLASSPVHAAGCGNSPAHEAFDIAGLKSELMVTALSCKSQERYNAFVAKFRPALLEAEENLNGYFKATYGRRAQAAHDDYITQLADVQSLGGLKSGTAFCEQREAMYDELNALETGADLAHYAEAKDVVQPASYESCASPAPVDRRSRHGSSTKSSTKSSSRHAHRA